MIFLETVSIVTAKIGLFLSLCNELTSYVQE